MIDPDGTVGKAARIIRGCRFGAAGSDEVVANVAVTVSEDVEVGEGWGSGLDRPRHRAEEDANRHCPKVSTHGVSPFSCIRCDWFQFSGGRELSSGNCLSEDENVLRCCYA